jgi:Tfp pilus assembly protein FimT
MKTKNSKGVTMLEMMIITAVIGITTTLAIPTFDQMMEKARLKTAGRDLISDLRFMRSNAVSLRQQFGIYFDSYSRRYILFKDVANLGAFTYDSGSDSDMVAETLPRNVNFGSCSFSNFVVIFMPDGSASSSGSIGLSSSVGGSGSFTVNVLSSTGRVKLISGS